MCLSYPTGSHYRVSLSLPEQSNAETDRDVVERVEAHHAHQQILQNNLRRGEGRLNH